MKKWTNLCGFRRQLSRLSAAALCLAVLAAQRASADSMMQAQVVPEMASGHGTVRGDRCNVRSRPNMTAEVVVQLNKGDTVQILGQKTSTERDKTVNWLQIALPASAKCYVSSKYLSDGVCTTDGLHVRCGKGANYREVGKLAKGDRVEVVAADGEWTQIRPTATCTGWISSDLVDYQMTAPAPVAAPVMQFTPPEVVTPAVAAPMAPMAPIEPAPMAPAQPSVQVISTDPDVHVQYVLKDGILRAVTDASAAPGSYELLTPEVERRQYRIAYLEAPGMNLERYEGKHVRVLGNARWHKGERYPIIAVDRVDMVW